MVIVGMLEPWYSVDHIRSLVVPSRLVEGGGSAVSLFDNHLISRSTNRARARKERRGDLPSA